MDNSTMYDGLFRLRHRTTRDVVAEVARRWREAGAVDVLELYESVNFSWSGQDAWHAAWRAEEGYALIHGSKLPKGTIVPV